MKDDKHQHGHGKHLLLMLIGCLIPIALILGMRYLNISGPVLSRFPFLLMLFICPLIHIFMMKGMMSNGDESCHRKSNQNENGDLK